MAAGSSHPTESSVVVSQECPASGSVTADDELARRNAIVLALANALAGANGTIVFAASGIVGHNMTGQTALATLPLSFFILGVMLGALPVARFAQSFGRRITYLLGNSGGAVAAVIASLSIFRDDFWLFCAAIFFAGIHQAVIQNFRFAAADTASGRFRANAISWVLAGGVASAVIGPQVVIWTSNLYLPNFFGISFIGQAFLAAAAAGATFFYTDQAAAGRLEGLVRPLGSILKQRGIITAIACGTIIQSLMNGVMIAAPLAMIQCGYSSAASSWGIQWHGIAMFAPSFFTGSLVARFGARKIAVTGFLVVIASSLVTVTGTSLVQFFSSLILLGFGWNFVYIAATAMLADYHSPAERGTIQGFTDFVI